jgi:hypothetical protein
MTSGCGEYIGEGLWELSFKFKFMDNENYMIFPLAAFARDDIKKDQC